MKWTDILRKNKKNPTPTPRNPTDAKRGPTGYGEEGTKEWFQTPLIGQLASDDWSLPGTHPLHDKNREYGDFTEQEIMDMMDRIKGVKAVDYVPTEEDMEKYKELADELEFRRADEEDWRSSLFNPMFGRQEDYTQGPEQWTEEKLRGPEVKDLGDEE